MSENSDETPIVNDAITSDDAGFNSDVGSQSFDEPSEEISEEISEESSEEIVEAETVTELKDEVEKAIEEGATEEEVLDMVKEFKLKVNGKEVIKKIDLSDEDALRRELQLAAAGQSAMQRQKELEKTYEEEIKHLLEQPWEVLEKLGFNPDEMAEQRLRLKVEELKKSPDQLNKEKLEKELQEARYELKKQQEEAESARFEQLQAEQAGKLENEIEAALDSHTTLPRSQKTVQRIADSMLWAMENGFEDVSVDDVIPTVEEEIKKELHDFMEQLPEEMMETYIGKKNIERLRQKRINSVKPNNISNVKPTNKESTDIKKEKKEKVRSKDYFRNL